MEKAEQQIVKLGDMDQIKELLNRLGFSILSNGTKYFLHYIALTMEKDPTPLKETAHYFRKSKHGVEDVISATLAKAWQTKQYWGILFPPNDLSAKPSYTKLAEMILWWMHTNEVIFHSCPERPLHSYTELRTKGGDFITL